MTVTKLITTLVLITSKDHKKVLLGMKKRGFGEGRWNGFGGKLKEGEGLEAAACREVFEEVGVTVKDLKKRGVITFYEADPLPIEVHIFSVNEFDGKPSESEEMKPKWFPFRDIPYSKMWPDDTHWLPLLLAGKNFEGEFWFKDQDNTDKITKFELREIA